MLNNPPGPLPRALYTRGSAPAGSEHPLSPAMPPPRLLAGGDGARAASVCPASPLGGAAARALGWKAPGQPKTQH